MIDSVSDGWALPEELALVGDPDLLMELISIFKQDVAARLQALRGAVMTGDNAAVGAQAHTIRGSAIQMGALHLVATCRHLELDAAHNVTRNMQRLLLEAEAEFRVLETTMHG